MKRWLLALLVIQAAAAEPDFSALGQKALELSRQYIRLRSVNPPANTEATAKFLQEVLAREGIPSQIFRSRAGRCNLLACLKGRSSQGRLLLLHHMDVVPADAARWPVDPYGGVVKEGYLWGRGAIDVKTMGVLQVLTLIALKREGIRLEHDVALLASADEESGGDDGALWMEKHHWKDLQPAYVLDEGGWGCTDFLSAEGKLTFAISVAEKKVFWCKLTALGTSGHGSQPVAENCNDRLREALNRLDRWMAQNPGVDSELVKTLRERCGRLSDNKFTRAIQRDTVSVTSLRSGVGDPPKVNVIPSKAEATLDFRLLPDTDLKAFHNNLLQLWKDIPGLTLEVTHSTDPCPVSSCQTPLYASLERAIREEYPTATVTPYLTPFGTDSNGMRQRGVHCYGLGTAVLSGSVIHSMHSDNERFPIDQFQPALRIYYRAVLGYASRP